MNDFLVQSLDRVGHSSRSQFRYLPPPHLAGCVNQKLGEAADITTVLASLWKQEIVAADGLGVAIGKEREGQAGFTNQLARFCRRVSADGERFNARILKRAERTLNPP